VDELPLSAAEFDRANVAFFEQSPAANIFIDENGHIVMANGEAERLFGYYREELLGRSFETLLVPRERSLHAAERQLFNADPRVIRWGTRPPLVARAKNGYEFPIDVAKRPIPTDDGLLIVITIADLSERYALEEACERVSRALAADALPALDELASIAERYESHDVLKHVQRLRSVIGDVLDEPLSTWSKT